MTSGDAVDAPKAEEARKVPSYMETLTEDVKERITSLQEIQKKHDEIEAEFQKEKAALYAKYEKLYAPFYEQRATIVNGSQEAAVEASKGVPDFWLNALKSNTLVAMQITEKDQEALKYLKDIRSHILTEPRGFKLEFHFAENPFFSNAVLTKEYQMADDEEPILEKAIGTNIEWKEGKNLTVKLMKKKAKKGSKDPPKVKLADCESFFNFFKPPDVPDNDDDLTSEEMEDLQDLLEQDYDIGSTIREKIVPHAISWFTGEAADDFDEEEDEEEEEEEDYDEEEDEDEDEDYESGEDEDEDAPTLVKEDKPE